MASSAPRYSSKKSIPSRANSKIRSKIRIKIRSKKRRNKSKKRFKIYKLIQSLLLTKGKRVSIRTLRKVPKKRLKSYLRKHFTKEEIAQYIPVALVYPSSQQIQSTTADDPSNMEVTTNSITNQNIPLGIILDINEPMAPTKEITTKEGVEFNKQIFSTDDDFTFDPGLWLTLPKFLPQKYQIPDTQFTSKLDISKNKLSSLHLQNQSESATQVEPYYLESASEINPTLEMINNSLELNLNNDSPSHDIVTKTITVESDSSE